MPFEPRRLSAEQVEQIFAETLAQREAQELVAEINALGAVAAREATQAELQRLRALRK